MTCAKCGKDIDEARVSAAIKLGDGRAALDWPCFDAMLKPGRAAELMRLLREERGAPAAARGASMRAARSTRTTRSEMRPAGKSDRNGRGSELAEQIALLRDAGVAVTPDYLLGRIKVEEAAEFLSTTPGEIYNLTSRRQIPFFRFGKRGLRFCRADLIRWQRQGQQ